MSYVVLARKYRPPNFSAMVGQEHVVQALTNALTQRRLHHAYLFTGTRGVGKTTVSRILAKSLNCTGADGSGDITATPCGVCDACRDIDAGRFVDYVELDAASNRGVEEITQLLDQAVYKPVLGRFKVYMIDEVHMLSNTAFNAMLKTLEEPPEYLKFVLATTDPQKVPPTVLSRCLQFNLRPMAPQTVHEHLAEVLAREGIAAEPGALRLLARAARGSMRDALSLTDQAIAYGAGTLAETGVRGMLGAVDRSHAVRIIEALAAGQGAQLVEAADALRALGLSAAATLEELATLLQQMAVLQAVPDAADATDPDAPETARLAALLAADETQLFYSIALNGRAELALAPDEYSGLVMVLLRMLAFKPQGDASKREPPRREAPVARANATGTASSTPVAVARAAALVAAAPAATALVPSPAPPGTSATLATSATSKPTPRAAPRADEPPPWLDAPFEDEAVPMLQAARQDTPERGSAAYAPVASALPLRVESPSAAPFVPAFAADGPGSRWAELVGRMVAAGSVQAMARELAMQSQCVVLEERAGERDQPLRCMLRVEREMLRNGTHVEKLQTALSETLGRAVRVEVESGAADDSPAKREAAERARRQAEAEQIVYNDPLVQALMKEFKSARIVPGSVRPH